MTKSLMSCQQLTKTYRDGDRELTVLNHVDITINAKEMLAIVGSSGSGKSTLLHLLGGLDKPSHGNVYFNQQDIYQWSQDQRADWRNQQLGFVYQFHHLLPEFDALENVMMPLLIGGMRKTEARERAANLLNLVGLPARANHRPAALSGGERQRVAIARALVTEPQLILADEPTGNLDATTAAAVYELMLELNQRLGTAFMLVTHDQALAGRLQRCLHLQQGQLVTEAGYA